MDDFIKNISQYSTYLDLVATVTNRKLHFIILGSQGSMLFA